MSDSKRSSESASRFYVFNRINGPDNPLAIAEGTESIDVRYCLHRLLASGRFSAVCLAHDGLSLYDVVLKIARIPDCEPEIPYTSPLHELQIYMKTGAHPLVLRVYDLHFNRKEVGERSDERTLSEVIL